MIGEAVSMWTATRGIALILTQMRASRGNGEQNDGGNMWICGCSAAAA